MKEEKYVPKDVYVFKSGKKKGKPAEAIMFDDYGFLNYLLDKMRTEAKGQKNALHMHLEWLISKGEDRKAKMICPKCGEKPIQYLSILGSTTLGYSMSHVYSCCDDQACKDALGAEAGGMPIEFYPVKFSSMLFFSLKDDRRQFAKVLRKVFELPKMLTKEVLFRFFSE